MPVKRQTAGPSVPTQKRTRFASSPPAGNKTGEIDDDLLEEDLPENAAQSRAKSRKQLKDQDGYGSDSSNDEEGVVPSRRTDAKEDEDDDVDMFADDVEEKEKEKAKAKEKGKEKEFMDLKDIQGQEFGQDGEEDEGYDSEVERQRRKDGLDGDMGIDIIPFNMKAEMEEGRFTADGETYVANDKDPNEKHDVWLDGMDDAAILKAREAHKERERLEREREEREEQGLEGGKGEQDTLMRVAVDLMERGETVLEALQRLGKEVEDKRRKEEAGSKKKSWAEKQKERKAAAELEAKEANDPYHTSNPFTNLSNVVAALTGTGQLDVYSLSRESIQRMLPAAVPSNGNGSAPPAMDERQFQYRFSMAYVRNLPESQRPVERELFGPYPILQLRQWRGTGAFGGPACENIELRQVGQEKWGSWNEVAEA